MSLTYDLIGVGGLGVDLTLSVDSLPLSDAKVSATLVGFLPGGFVANATCAAAQLGLRAGFVGWVGDDNNGALLRRDFEHWGVDQVGLVTLSEAATALVVVITDSHGQRCILLPHTPIYSQPLAPEQGEYAAQARVIYSYPRDRAWCDMLYAAALRSGSVLALDIETVNLMPPADLLWAIDQATLVFLSAESLKHLDVESIGALGGPGRWVIQTAGVRGAFGIAGGQSKPVFVPARTVPKVVDTTGAGDTFHAAVIAAYLDGASLPDALEFATAAAALKIQHLGARGGLPTRADILALLRDEA